jgi:hypothetical protein
MLGAVEDARVAAECVSFNKVADGMTELVAADGMDCHRQMSSGGGEPQAVKLCQAKDEGESNLLGRGYHFGVRIGL